LDWFFNQWVFGSGVVTINIGGATAYQDATGWTVTLQIYQSQNPPIALRVPIHAVTVTGTEVTWVSMNAAPVQLCQISVTALPSRLIIDPDQLLLCRYSLATAYVGLSPNSPLFQQIVIVAVVVLVVVGVLTYLWYRRRRAKPSLPEASSAYRARTS
jgi:hypothetical protein